MKTISQRSIIQLLSLCLFCLVCFQNFVNGYEISLEDQDLNRHTFLVSYGGSGNSWTRYCLEFLTKRPTLKFHSKYKFIKKIELDTESKELRMPINNTIPSLGVDYSKLPFFKVHNFRSETPLKKFDENSNAIFILLLRNPKECVLRSHHTYNKTAEILRNPKYVYYVNLLEYEKWNPEKRKIVHYEDLLQFPEKTLKDLLDFLGEDDTYLSEFMRDFSLHKQRSLEFYQCTNHSSFSKGKSPIFHSKNLTDQQKISIDKIIEKTHPKLWKKYLLRYAESKSLSDQHAKRSPGLPSSKK